MKYVLIALPFMVLTACATPTYNYTPKVEYISRPEIGVQTTAAVGDEMLVQGNLSAQDGVALSQPQKVSMYSFSPGFYPQVGDNDKDTFFSFVAGDGKTSVAGRGTAKKGLLADPLKSIAISKESGKFCAVTVLNVKSCTSKVDYKKDNRSNEGLNSFQQTLIYSGRVGDKINIGYREFSGSSARPAFNNDVEYDLSTDRTIAYKGAEVDVVSADNKQIVYVVNKNFRQP